MHPALTQDVPLVGQPYKLGGWFITANLLCQCDAKTSLLLVGSIGATCACPACHRAYRLDNIAFNPETGQMHFGFGIGTAMPQGQAASPLIER